MNKQTSQLYCEQQAPKYIEPSNQNMLAKSALSEPHTYQGCEAHAREQNNEFEKRKQADCR